MFLRENRRLLGLAVLLGLALVAAFADPPQRDVVTPTVAAEPPGSRSHAARAPSAAELLAKLHREPIAEAVGGELFGGHAWQAPAAGAAAVPAAPAMPTVPAFPYRYLGRLAEQAGRTVVFLTRGENTYSVSAGATLEDVYRIDRIDEDQFHLTYLPLKAPVTVRFEEIPQPLQQQAGYGPGFALPQPVQQQPVFAAPQTVTGVVFPKPPVQPPPSAQVSASSPTGSPAPVPDGNSSGTPLSLGSDPIVQGPIPGTPMQVPPVPEDTMEISQPSADAPVPGFEAAPR